VEVIMTLSSTFALVSLFMLSVASAQAADPSPKSSPTKNPSVLIKTSLGDITVELDQLQAPISTKNFLDYVDAKFYDGTIFHRVIPGFMIQGGGFTPNMQQKTTKAPIKNEAGNGLKNLTGTIAMARTGIVDSATSQFFINVADNAQLNHRDESPAGFGYAVFGKVTAGMDIVKKIEVVKTTARPPHQNVPETPVVIESVTRVMP
jgi:cyclophilin family peptidyl-prolyl cis-trans isomerase